ncbi:MAG: arylamine N-acetyltransferase, partial [Phycisphaeraceae bacterium]|nr:arylamine N-acetyltransferase [Phycisphaeraceae bacterium]
IDFEPANYYVSTHPQSRFTRTLTVQLPTPTARYTLIDREFGIDYQGRVERRLLTDEQELAQVLDRVFGLSVDTLAR